MQQMQYSLEEVIASKGERAPLLYGAGCNLQDPGNLGTILRAGEAAGVTGVLMSSDTVDIYNPKVIRSTMGSIYRMPFIYVEHFARGSEDVKCKRNSYLRSTLKRKTQL